MATVESFTKARLLALEAATVVDGHIDGSGHLILTQHDGTEIDAGDALVGLPNASTTVSGAVELATNAETITGTDTVRATTPSGVAAALAAFVPDASSTVKGKVELATDAEAITGTDTVRAVTPASLAAAIAAVPGDMVQNITAPAESASYASYPVGLSITSVSTGDGWSLNSSQGTILTVAISNNRTYQLFYANSGGTQNPASWLRSYHSANGGGGWTAWHQIDIPAQLAPASFSQTTAFTSYPQGSSRIYMNNTQSTSGGWSFGGKYGELLTFRDGSDFAHQTWRKHYGGSGGNTELWMRTANSSGGWSAWKVLGFDTDPQSVEDVSVITGITSTTGQVGTNQVYILFTAPPSGKVWVTISGYVSQSQNSFETYLGFNVRAGSTPGSGTVFLAEDFRRGIAAGKAVVASGPSTHGSSRRYLVTGLTAGSAYVAQALYWVSSGSASGSCLARGLAVELV